MNIGLFTDTYFPQVSGVATSIKTLKDELERRGNHVYIFTTTDPNVEKNDDSEKDIYRFSSVPFISFTERRIAVRGIFQAYQIAKQLKLDIVHTQTEFSLGIIGKFVAKNLNIPCIHTYHTMYEDYLHYVANGKLLKPIHVKEMMLAFCHHMDGVVAPSKRVLDKLTDYGVKSPIRIIPTGIDVKHYEKNDHVDIRKKLGLNSNTPVMVSVSRVAYEKNISEMIDALPKILKQVPNAMLVIVGEGPAEDDLMKQVSDMKLNDHVIFTGEINNNNVNDYYRMADVFVSTSNSESQGLTYIEAVAAGTKVVVARSPYTDDLIDDKSIGMTFESEDKFVEETVDYLQNRGRYPDYQNVREQKLHEISAEYFVDQMLSFYEDTIREFDRTKAKQTNTSD
ncbi:glycosyltransferase family 4 protein [Fructilactobacillus fructivorans]|uniref:Glycosyltransferase LafA, responsible for the formation of Glc-DAG n=1 Tax=Fructilactobacillus fructivorans TaxID=1614 RepID=A0A0C1PN31_9LACO|nr:glycosyltransferase family 4 protein [Fructilactobacillus fructivorans]KID41326.1 Glycosyltransferase LafA, responsible for the formation of Glc-DAG [Fructilactobacillus fructivorans]MCT0151787.1 glycosyltransferase family 4 protein [Fructilactobacillus fructivorans]MCT2867085.1 glycosyltransferase family 4 protein [Fructilactobacillus fructivorans]MCT2868355.1 glycosyltransferase family 4 protein [Fructilactobacillus fructivorans]MCT2873063.1 glycosyltransferase family 4 protein [Fructilac